jgi:hypothetical protein
MNKKLEALARTEASTKQSRASFVVQRPSAYSRSILTSSETIFERKARLIILGWFGTWGVGRFRWQMISMQAPAHPCWGTAPYQTGATVCGVSHCPCEGVWIWMVGSITTMRSSLRSVPHNLRSVPHNASCGVASIAAPLPPLSLPFHPSRPP